MAKVIVDTNIIVSALLKPNSTPDIVLSSILSSNHQLYITKKIFQEYKGVLARKKFKKIDGKKVSSTLSKIEKTALFLENSQKQILKLNLNIQDDNDKKFLECAILSDAEFLITGNSRHFNFGKFHNTLIITVADFMVIDFKSRLL